MRIAFDAKRAFNNFTGLGNYSRTLISSLTTHFPEHDYLLFTTKVNEELLKEVSGIFSIHLPKQKLYQSFHALWRSYGIKQQLIENKTAVFHGLSNELPFNTHTFPFPTVVTIHDLLYLKHPEDFPWIDRLFYKAKTEYACKHADIITVNSQQTKRDLIDYLSVPEKKIVVVPHAIRDTFHENRTQAEVDILRDKYKLPESFLLQTGSFIGRKNHARVIAAFHQIKQHTDAHLVFVGHGGSAFRAVKNQIDAMGLSSRIHIIPQATAADMPLLYCAAKAVLYPSLDEGFGLPILEAFATRKPVITTAGKCFEEVAGNAAIFVDPFSEQSIASAITKVLADDNLCAALVANGQKRLSLFSPRLLAEGTMNIYESLL